jgi:hypothetical protein
MYRADDYVAAGIRGLGGWSGLPTAESTTVEDAASFAYFAKGGYDDAMQKGSSERTEVAASPPALAKNARMEHPPWEWCDAKMGHPPGGNLPSSSIRPLPNQMRSRLST